VVIAQRADEVADAALAEFFDRGLERRVADFPGLVELAREIVDDLLVRLQFRRPLAGGDVGNDGRAQAGLERNALVRVPIRIARSNAARS